jgi:hypothetical protein
VGAVTDDIDETERKYAVYQPATGWLVDTCAGGTFSWNVDDAVWFGSHIEAHDALKAAEITLSTYQIIRMK